MVYNRFHYNTALWNAGREEELGIAKSIIQAHTGPHVQAVIGAAGGTTLISDFIITEGTVKKPPTQYKFPDMTAFIRAYQIRPSNEGTAAGFAKNDLASFIRAQLFRDMPACVFIVNHSPDLPAKIFGLFEANLLAFILGKLGEHDLPAVIQATVANLAAIMLGIPAPNLPGTIFAQPTGNLGARIHAPADLGAVFFPVQLADLIGAIRGFQFKDLPGFMLGIPAPQILAFIRGVAGDIKNLPARTLPLTFIPGMPAEITPVFTGETGFAVGLLTQITSHQGGFDEIIALIRAVGESTGDLGALIKTGGELDLPAVIQLLGGASIPASIGTIPLGEKDRFLNAFAQALHPADLGAIMTLSENVAFLGASILSLSDTDDLGARIKVAETFITALLTVSTLTSRDLRATIGKPGCAGGSATSVLSAFADVQHAKNLTAFLQSFLEKNLGASINSEDIFFAFDTIDVKFTPFKLPGDPRFNATDTIPVLFSPFRGKNLSAIINTVQNNVFLTASITPVFPLPRVVPAVNRLTAADLRINEPQNIQEIRLQLEGALLEYIYVNGTETSFIKDPNEDWKINIRSFKPIAEGLFGDHAAAKVCRLGALTSFRTMDQAVRFCIQAVLGFESQEDMSARITAKGGINNLTGFLTAQNTFGDLLGIANRVFPVDLGAQLSPTGDYNSLRALIQSTAPGAPFNLGAVIAPNNILVLSGTISGSGGPPFESGTLNAFLLNSRIGITEIKSLAATIDLEKNEQTLYFSGGGNPERVEIDTLDNLGFGLGRQFSVAFWIRWDSTSADGLPTDGTGVPIVFDSIIGASSSAPAQKVVGGGPPGWEDGFGFYWSEDGVGINFFVNDFNTNVASVQIDAREELTQWIHVVGTYDADAASGNMRMYLNGNSAGSTNLFSDLIPVSSGTKLEIGRIGADQVSAAFPNQWMDEIGIWPNVALSGTEVAAIFDPGFQHHNLKVNKGAYVHAEDLAVYYQFEDTAFTFPTVVNAVSSGTFDGTMVNMDVSTNLSDRTLLTDSNVLQFDQTVYYFNDTQNDLPLAENGQGSFTTVMWIRPSSLGNNDRRIMGLWHSGDQVGESPTLGLYHDNDQGGNQRFRVRMNTQANSEISIYAQFDIDITFPHTWYHLAITYDFTTRVCNFYVNNVFRATGTLNAARKRTGEFTLGTARRTNNVGANFDGEWEMNAWWDRALTTDELTEIWNGGASGGEVDLKALDSSDDLTAWYRLGEVPDQLLFLRSRHGSLTEFTSGNLDNQGSGGASHQIISDTPFNPDP